MKKFKCYGCSYKNCYVEQDGDVFTPFCCVHGWDGDADWQEVKEEPKEKEMKNIHCIDLDIYGNLTTTSTTTFF